MTFRPGPREVKDRLLLVLALAVSYGARRYNVVSSRVFLMESGEGWQYNYSQ